MLVNIIDIVKKIKNYKYENHIIKGDLCLTNDDIGNINKINDLVELQDSSDEFFSPENLTDHINEDISIEINVNNIKGYYDSSSSFIIQNKIEFKVKTFYLKEEDFFYKEGQKCSNERINNYLNNIKLIDFLKSISDYKNQLGSDLELFFYQAKKGLKLKIDYQFNDLKPLNINILNELENHFFDKPDKEERKQIFINELVSLLKNDGSYKNLLKKFESIKDNYDKSFKLYLSGFSFEKIKTSSLGYIQELTDRIYNQINKATANIFIIPTAYIFVLKSFAFSDSSFQNFLLLITAFIFSLLMHKIIFSTMEEGLDSITFDIEKLREKLGSKFCQDIKEDLEKLDKQKERQSKKIILLKWINWILFLFAFFMFAYTVLNLCHINWIFNKLL